MSYFLTSERLGFRCWRPDDVDLARSLWSDPEVTRFTAGTPPTIEQAAERLALEIASERQHGVQYWPMFARGGADEVFVGCCGLRPYPRASGVFELGVHVRPAFWRQGLAREAARAVIDHAFARLDVAALFAGHHPANAASRQLIAALGFHYTHDELYPPTGLPHPSYRLVRPPPELVASRAALRTLADVLAWAFALVPAGEVHAVVVQDEFTHDVVIALAGGTYLVFDTT